MCYNPYNIFSEATISVMFNHVIKVYRPCMDITRLRELGDDDDVTNSQLLFWLIVVIKTL